MTGRRVAPARAAFVAGLALVFLTAAGCGGNTLPEVIVSPAAAGTLQVAPAGSGTVQAEVDRAIVVERRATVTSLDVVQGQQVRRGQRLLTVYTIGASAAVAAATNTLRADEKLLQSVRARDGAAAASTVGLLAKVAHDRSQLATLKSSPTVVTAPVDGHVSAIAATVGDQLTRTNVVMHVVDDRNLRVTVPLAATYRRLVQVGQSATLSVPGGSGQSVPATVVTVGSSAAPATSTAGTKGTSGAVPADTVLVTISLPGAGGAITLGSSVYVRFPIRDEAPVAVNSLAVLGQDQTPFVLVVRDGRISQRPVLTGVSDDARTEILKGVSVGDQVVISGGHQLLDGDEVQATEESAGSQAAGR